MGAPDRPGQDRNRLENLALLGGSVALLALLVLGMGTPRAWWTRNRPLSFEAASAAGLTAGMDVRLSGYPIGRVDHLRLLPSTRVQVTLSVAADKLAMLRPGSRASIAQDSLLGKPYIAITPASAPRPGPGQLASTPRLIYEPSANLMTLIEDLTESRLTLQQMLSRTSTLMERRLPRSLDQLDRTLGSGESLATTLRQEVVKGSATLQQRVGSTGDQAEETLSELRTTLVDVQTLVRHSNALLREIRRSWLMHLLEPASKDDKGESDPPDPRP
jgi:phospholipid/cholesterol/gamma-HCH transport system substrate-binding protein